MADLLVFQVREQLFAVPITDVKEVVRAVKLTPLPHAPQVLQGMINYRGQVICVLSMRAMFELSPREVEPQDSLIIIEQNTQVLALLVDRPMGLTSLEEEPLPEMVPLHTANSPLRSVARSPEGMVLILHLEQVLQQVSSIDLPNLLDWETSVEIKP